MTSEADADVRVRKLRVMVVKESLLLKIANGKVPEPNYESPTHNVRWKTLRQMAQRYQPGGAVQRDRLLRTIELCVPRGSIVADPAHRREELRDVETTPANS